MGLWCYQIIAGDLMTLTVEHGKSAIPPIIYGTAWKEDDTQRLVVDALESGFRGIDTANQRKHYFEQGVGLAVQQFLNTSKITRGDLFLQTKFTSENGQDDRKPYNEFDSLTNQVKQSFASSLTHLQTDYIDSYTSALTFIDPLLLKKADPFNAHTS